MTFMLEKKPKTNSIKNLFVPTHSSGARTKGSTGFFIQSVFADRYIPCTEL